MCEPRSKKVRLFHGLAFEVSSDLRCSASQRRFWTKVFVAKSEKRSVIASPEKLCRDLRSGFESGLLGSNSEKDALC